MRVPNNVTKASSLIQFSPPHKMSLPHKQSLQLKLRQQHKLRLASHAETASQAVSTIKTEAHCKSCLTG